MDLPSWEHDLKVDLEVIDALLASMNKITPRTTPSSSTSRRMCWRKIANPINPGNKKVLIFTAFADTADYLYANLAPGAAGKKHMAAHRQGHRQGRAEVHAQEGLRLPGTAHAVLPALQGEGRGAANEPQRSTC
jgi:hypothetical protein